jgi:hypothetical protein
LLVGGEPALIVERRGHLAQCALAHPRRVAGHVHERAQQRRHGYVLQRSRNRVVVVGEGLTRVWIPHAALGIRQPTGSCR